jgi:hypothetical protein
VQVTPVLPRTSDPDARLGAKPIFLLLIGEL